MRRFIRWLDRFVSGPSAREEVRAARTMSCASCRRAETSRLQRRGWGWEAPESWACSSCGAVNHKSFLERFDEGDP